MVSEDGRVNWCFMKVLILKIFNVVFIFAYKRYSKFGKVHLFKPNGNRN